MAENTGSADNTSQQALDTLVLLATKFEEEGRPMQAIHCLYALLRARLLPDQEAKARLSLGRLLLQHTHNQKDAQKALQRAVSVTACGCCLRIAAQLHNAQLTRCDGP